MEIFDWDSIQIVETHDDEGRIALMSENQICELLGLIEEDTTIYLHMALIAEWMNRGMIMSLGKIMMVLPFLLVMPYQVKWLFHMIRTTHPWI